MNKTFYRYTARKITALSDEIMHYFSFLFPRKKLIILDDLYPHPISIFRNIEFNTYIEKFKNVQIYSSGDALGAVHDKRSLPLIIKKYNNKTKVLTHHKLLKSKLVYSLFLNITYGFLPYIERNNLPFIFTLYPGGGFYLNHQESDNKLKRIFSSPLFRKVIVTQNVTRDYLLTKQLCPAEKIEFIYGVVSAPLDKKSWDRKLLFGKDKETLDICFIANKNMPHGYDKGYDLFIETLKLINQEFPQIRAHVVGPYEKSDYNIEGISNICFHGFIEHENFVDFFRDKDIIVSPNRSFVLNHGAFDGFPTASCTEAAANGVAMFISDSIGQNVYFESGKDCVIIENNAIKIANELKTYLYNPHALYQLARNGYEKTHEIYSYEKQLLPRIDILKTEISKFNT